MAGNELFERLELLLVWDKSKSAVKTLGAVWSDSCALPVDWMPATWEMCILRVCKYQTQARAYPSPSYIEYIPSNCSIRLRDLHCQWTRFPKHGTYTKTDKVRTQRSGL